MADHQLSTPDKTWPIWTAGYLEALALTGNHSAACRAASVDRTTPYVLLKADATFAEARQGALDDAADLLVLEARRRAKDGVDEPVIFQGQLCGTWTDAAGNVVAPETPGATMVPLTVKKYSDPLLMFLIKKERPEYRERAALEVTGKDGGPIERRMDVFVHIEGYAREFRTAAERELLESGLPADRFGEPLHPPGANGEAGPVPGLLGP